MDHATGTTNHIYVFRSDVIHLLDVRCLSFKWEPNRRLSVGVNIN